MSNKPQSPLLTLELKFWDRISEDFPLEIACINRSLELIHKINDYLYDEVLADVHVKDPVVLAAKILRRPMYDPGKPPSQWRKPDRFRKLLKRPDQLPQMVWSFLCSEATDRLVSARLLILAGHYSRALSCIRDANECLRWADYCLKDEQASERWLESNKVKVPNSFQYTPPLSKHMGPPGFLDMTGTHAYVDAVEFSILPAGIFVDDSEYSKNETVKKTFLEHTMNSLGILLIDIWGYLLYLTNIDPALTRKFTKIDDMKRAIDYLESKLVDRLEQLDRTHRKYLEEHYLK